MHRTPQTLATLSAIVGLKKEKDSQKALSATYKSEQVVELLEDIDLPKDMAVLVVIPEQEDKEVADIDEIEWLRAVAANPVFDFLKKPEEDIYTLANRRPFCDLG